MEDILNTDFSYVWYLYRRTLWQSYVCAVAYGGHFCFGSDLTKPSITTASVDRFYSNLVICLKLDIALLIQNSVTIWHCLSELWQCIQGGYFFPGHSVFITPAEGVPHWIRYRRRPQKKLGLPDGRKKFKIGLAAFDTIPACDIQPAIQPRCRSKYRASKRRAGNKKLSWCW